MAVYTIHEPPLRKGETSPDPDRFVLVRDGFYVWAFLLGPVWMAWRRLWLVLVLYVLAAIGAEVLLRLAGATASMKTLIALAVALLVGLEAATLRRWTLNRRGWKNIGVVVGDDRESAERRFFADWIDNRQSPQQAGLVKPQTPVVARMSADPGQDIIGLFPESGKPR